MRLPRTLLIWIGIVIACSDSTREPPVPASLVIAPDTGWLLLGGQRRLSAQLAGSAGDPLPDRPLEWQALTPATVAISDEGLVTGLSLGSAQVEARFAALADTLEFSVDGPTGPMPIADFRCGGWDPAEPSPDRLWLEVFAPDSSFVPALTARGGRITRSFNLPFVRVLFDRDSVPGLLQATSPFLWLVTVADTLDTRFIVVIGYTRPASPADTAALRAFGAEPRFLGTDWASAELPDSLVPALRAWPQVAYVDPNFPVCTAARP